MRNTIAAKGCDFFWADETEPDLPPDGAYLSVGPGTQYLNVYPLFHTAALYDGVRRDRPEQRVLTLSRDAYRRGASRRSRSRTNRLLPEGSRASSLQLARDTRFCCLDHFGVSNSSGVTVAKLLSTQRQMITTANFRRCDCGRELFWMPIHLETLTNLVSSAFYETEK